MMQRRTETAIGGGAKCHLSIRLSADEKAALERLAEADGIGIGDWVRYAIRRAVAEEG